MSKRDQNQKSNLSDKEIESAFQKMNILKTEDREQILSQGRIAVSTAQNDARPFIRVDNVTSPRRER